MMRMMARRKRERERKVERWEVGDDKRRYESTTTRAGMRNRLTAGWTGTTKKSEKNTRK